MRISSVVVHDGHVTPQTVPQEVLTTTSLGFNALTKFFELFVAAVDANDTPNKRHIPIRAFFIIYFVI